MPMRSIAIARLLTAAGPVALFGSGDAQHLAHTIDAEGATSVSARIGMATGSLTVRGGASALMEGDFTYDPELEPQFSYIVRDGRGELRVEQPKNRGGSRLLRNVRNDWDIRLNNDLPLDLRVTVASGDSLLEAAALNLTGLELDSASGDCEVELGGLKQELGAVHARLASGNLRMDLTGDYGQSVQLNVSTASGDVELDLRGMWSANSSVQVRVVSGDVNLLIPANLAVRGRARTISGNVRATGLQRSGSGFVRDVPGATAGLNIEVESVSGDVRLDAR